MSRLRSVSGLPLPSEMWLVRPADRERDLSRDGAPAPPTPMDVAETERSDSGSPRPASAPRSAGWNIRVAGWEKRKDRAGDKAGEDSDGDSCVEQSQQQGRWSRVRGEWRGGGGGGVGATMDLKESSGSEDSCSSLGRSSWELFARHSTLHGLRFVFARGPLSLRRLLWGAALLASLALLALESAERLALFFSYPHVISVGAVAAPSLLFPAVTVCNLNRYRFPKLTRNDLYHAGELLALLDVHLRIQDAHLAEPHVLDFLDERANFTGYKPKPFSMQEFTERVGHDLREMMLYCRFQGQECSHRDFATVSPPPVFRPSGRWPALWSRFSSPCVF
ncbi:hypothetical protein SKAU_G00289890 [Synaphobranchus kaupii]|uniref:Acid-sensing ion channel 2 n=1 Tax=Synaphobranchus kaupii TaxID=118154 RepID=A0A9Q1ETH8_SYNKA|nr:hypothetical protein SKAU_G00289890 [Synaphobranchus kaupii]